MSPQEEREYLEYLRLKKRKAHAKAAAPDVQPNEVQPPTAPLPTWSIAGLGQKFGADMQTERGRQEWKERAAILPTMLQHGADLGLSDEIAGMASEGAMPMLLPERMATGIKGLLQERSGTASPAYNALAGDKNAEIDAAREAHPVTAMGAEMVGGSVIPGSTLGAGKTIIGQAARTALPAAAVSGVYGYNDAPEGERLKSAGINAAFGGATGGIIGGAGGAVSKIEPSVGRVFDTERFGSMTPREETRLVGLLGHAGYGLNDIAAAFRAFEESVQGVDDLALLPSRLKDVLVDQLGPGAQKVVDDFLTGAANRSGTQGATTIASGVAEDKVRLGQFANDSAESRFGSASRFDTSEAADQEMARLGKEGYERVFNQPATGDLTDLGETLQFYAGSKLNKPLQQIAAGNMQSVEQMVAKDPRRAAHWMQSTAHQLADQADQAGNTPLANAYRTMRDNILKRLEPATPGYKEVRQQFGTEFTNQRALTAGDRFLSIAEDDMKLGQFLKQMEAMTPDERAAALLSIRDTLQKNMNRHTEGGLPRTAIVAREPVLNALERLGPEGTAFANDLRMIQQRAGRTTAIDSRAGSQTTPRQKADQFVDDVVANPISRRIGKAMETIGGDAAISGISGFLNPVMTGRAMIRGMGNAFANGRQRKADSLTDLLMRDAGAAPRLPMSGDTPPTVTGGGQAAPTNTLATPDQNAMPQSNRVNAFAASDSGHVATEVASELAGGAGGFAFAPDVNRDGEVGIVERLGAAGVGAFGAQKGMRTVKQKVGDAIEARKPLETLNLTSKDEILPLNMEQSYQGENMEWRNAAKKGLDMSTDARMSRAQEMGFDTDTVLYHGTREGKQIEKSGGFELGHDGSGGADQGAAIFLSTDPKVSAKFSGLDEDYGRFPATYPVLVKGKLKEVDIAQVRDEAGGFHDNNMLDEIEIGKSEGFEGLIIKNSDEGGRIADEYVIFDPKNTRSVNAAFDPDEADSSLLMSGFGGAQSDIGNTALGAAVGGFAPADSTEERARNAFLMAGATAGAGRLPNPRHTQGSAAGLPRKPKIQKDIPLGTPKKAGPSRMDGNTIAKGYDDASGMGAARAVGDASVVRNQARTEAGEMLKKGSMPKDVHKRTGLMPIEYNGKTTLIEAPDMTPDQVLTMVYTAISDPAKASPPMRAILEDLGVVQSTLQLGSARAPQILGGRSTPMIKDKPANPFNSKPVKGAGFLGFGNKGINAAKPANAFSQESKPLVLGGADAPELLDGPFTPMAKGAPKASRADEIYSRLEIRYGSVSDIPAGDLTADQFSNLLRGKSTQMIHTKDPFNELLKRMDSGLSTDELREVANHAYGSPVHSQSASRSDILRSLRRHNEASLMDTFRAEIHSSPG